MYHGIINVYKEAGFTSHDVVAKLRGICKQKKIGHTGTLDPDAYKVSLRSNGKIDVAKIAMMFGGGGHVRAAGVTMQGTYHDIINNLSAQIEKQLCN